MTAPTRRRRSSVPWQPNDLTWLVVLSLLAVIGIGVAWYQTSGIGELSHQLSWLNLAVVSIVVASVGNLMWIVNGRRAVGIRRRELLARWDVDDEPAPSSRFAVEPSPALVTPAARSGVLVRAAGMSYAHDPSCPLMAGKTAVEVGERNPVVCAICHP